VAGLIVPFRGMVPRIDPTAFVAPTATIIGDVEIGADSGIWFGVTIRGDVHEIRIGKGTNIQDGTVIHISSKRFGTYIGDGVTVGHCCLIHACVLEDKSFIGMNATVMDGAVVESGAMVAAGALVTPGTRVEKGKLWAGVPAKCRRDLGDSDHEMMGYTAPHYAELAREYRLEAEARDDGV
jgi:carbonic anhydrase/acetyltransferase-like protein (isoleucine patch superfamily)